jgi:hypothetical protein
MKDFLDFMSGNFKLIVTERTTFLGLVFVGAFNALLRFAVLYGVIYVTITAFKAAM